MENKPASVLYFGPAPGSTPHKAEYWTHHVPELQNPAIKVQKLPDNRIIVEIEVRNHSQHDVEDAKIRLFVVECAVSYSPLDVVEVLLQSIVTDRAPLAEWLHQRIPAAKPNGDVYWSIPYAPIQTPIEPNFGGNFIIVVTAEHGEISFLQSLDHHRVSMVPEAAVYSSTLPVDYRTDR